ncbi:hypothetical protein CVT24_010998 [Panaeolus cyanescens]|uniref:Uncharacterized protein n=1 Tax=Panaeolus cyanescens TaxID=181874 RepID=A0A409YV68_9AGAR|nr:hypothetical protein CVT24_010998 [Panaeolus cyanescens]
MDIAPTRRRRGDEGMDGEGDGTFVSTSASSESTLHQSVNSTWTQARLSEGPDSDINHVPTVGRRDGLELKRRPLDPHMDTRSDTSYLSARTPLSSMTTERLQGTTGLFHALPDDSDHDSAKAPPKPGTTAPNSSPCPTSHLAMPDITSDHSHTEHDSWDNHHHNQYPTLGPVAGPSQLIQPSQSSTRTRLPANLVSDNPEVENDAQDPQLRILQPAYASHWTPPSSPSLPDSDSESVSSFPSVSSSFFFSSAGASPHLAGLPDGQHFSEDRHGGSRAAPSRKRSRQGLQLGGYPRPSTSSRANSKGRSGRANKGENTSHSSLENLPHAQKPIPLSDRKGSRTSTKETAIDLAIPTLSLPTALPRPTQYGQTLGKIRLVLLSDPFSISSSGTTSEEAIESVLKTLIWDNQDVIDAGNWESVEGGSQGGIRLHSLHASTDWLPAQPSDLHPQPSFYTDEKSDKFEGTDNVEVIKASGVSSSTLEALTASLKELLLEPFQDLSMLLLPSLSQTIDTQDEDDAVDITAALAQLLASSDSTPLFTAMVTIVGPNGPSDSLKPLIREISSLVPVIILPLTSQDHSSHFRRRSYSSSISKAKLSTFSPTSVHSLLVGLFRTPETLKKLRMEAVERFLKWREVEGEVARSLALSTGIPLSANLSDSISSETQHPLEYAASSGVKRRIGMGARVDKDDVQRKWQEWKQQWEREWMESFSVDVASRLREERGYPRTPTYTRFTTETSGNRKRVRTVEHGEGVPHGQELDSPSSPVDNALTQSTTLGQPSDPLHIPSLIILSLSLLGPLKQRLREKIKGVLAIFWDTNTSLSAQHTYPCSHCGSIVTPGSRRERELAARASYRGNRRLVLVGIGGLMIGVSIGLCVR